MPTNIHFILFHNIYKCRSCVTYRSLDTNMFIMCQEFLVAKLKSWKLYGCHHDLVNLLRNMCLMTTDICFICLIIKSRSWHIVGFVVWWPRIYVSFVVLSNPVHDIYRRICCMCNTTGVTNGTGITNPYATTKFATAEFVVDFRLFNHQFSIHVVFS